jgi:uncharacterized protein DUF5683
MLSAAVLTVPTALAAPPPVARATPDSLAPRPVAPSAADSATVRSATARDSSGAVTIPSAPEQETSPTTEVARVPRTLPRQERFDQPRWVMLRSLLVPGWGQAHNRAWIKASLLVVGDGTLRWRLVSDERRLTRLNGQAVERGTELVAADAELAAAQAELTAAEASGDSTRIAAAQAALLAANLKRGDASNAYNSIVGAYNALLNGATNRRWLAVGVIAYALLDAYVDAHFRSFDVNFKVDPALPGGGKTPGARLQIGWRF